MSCRNCPEQITCNAHIMPAAVGKDIIKSSGKKLTLLAPEQEGTSQSGIWDSDILCGPCDNVLGSYDTHAINITRLLGTTDEAINHRTEVFTLSCAKGIDHERLALFGAAVVWRASVSTVCRELNGFSLGNNEEWFRQMIFREVAEVPIVTIARIVGRDTNEQKMADTAMLYPVRVRPSGSHISMARFYLRGLMFLVQTTRNKKTIWSPGSVTELGKSAGSNCLIGSLMPFARLGGLEDIKKSKHMRKRYLY